MKLKLSAVMLSAVLLAGCSATPESCDPSVELGLLDKLACQTSGSYQSRVDQKETTLRQEAETNDNLSDAYVETKNQQAATSQKVSSKSAQLKSVTKSVNANKATLAKKQQSVAQLKQQIAQTQKQIAAIKASTSLSSSEKEKQLKELQSILSQKEQEAAAAAGF